jgi:hypothetical protein
MTGCRRQFDELLLLLSKVLGLHIFVANVSKNRGAFNSKYSTQRCLICISACHIFISACIICISACLCITISNITDAALVVSLIMQMLQYRLVSNSGDATVAWSEIALCFQEIVF